MLQIKDSRTAGSTVAGMTHEDYVNTDGQHANSLEQGFDCYDGNSWCFQHDYSQAIISEGNSGALEKGGGRNCGKGGGKPNSGNDKNKCKPGMGNYMRCHNCGSKQHMIRDCPHPKPPRGGGG